MKQQNLSLERLFAAARAVPSAAPEAIPGPLQTRILARWRSGETPADWWLPVAQMFRRALVCAVVVMVISIVWSYGMSETPIDDEAIANLELRADLMP